MEGKPILTDQIIITEVQDPFANFRDPFTPKNYPGKLVNYQGKRIKIVQSKGERQINEFSNRSHINDKTRDWKIVLVIFETDEETVFLIQDQVNKKVPTYQNFKQKHPKVKEYLEEFQGYCLIRGKSISSGKFVNFNKEGQCIDLSIEAVDEEMPIANFWKNNEIQHVLRIFKGSYTHNVKDSGKEASNIFKEIPGYNKVKFNLKMVGVYKCGYAQGTHRLVFSENGNRPVNQTVQYHNGCIVDKGSKKQISNRKWTSYKSHFSVSISEKTIQSLKPKEWLNPEVIDYFFRRLVFYHQSMENIHRLFNFKVMPIEFFEKLMPSMHIPHLDKKVNFHSVNFYFEPFEDIVSFFEVYQLVIFPLSRDRQHFALGAVRTEVKRNKKNQIEQVDLKIYDFDSIYEDNVVGKRIGNLLEESLLMTPQKDRVQFNKAISKAKGEVKTVKTFQARKQTNGYDCGLYVCLYGYLLYKYHEKHCQQHSHHLQAIQNPKEDSGWSFSNQQVDELRKTLQSCMLNRERDFIVKVKKILIKKPRIVSIKHKD